MKDKIKEAMNGKGRTTIRVCMYLIITIFFLVLSYLFSTIESSVINDFFANCISNILMTIGSITGVSSVYELFSKKVLIYDLYEKFNIAHSVVNSGIEEIFYNEENLNWGEVLRDASTLEIFSCGDKNWIDVHKKTLVDFLSKNGSIIFYFPDIGNSLICNELDERHNKNKGTLKSNIEEIIEEKYGKFFELYKSQINIKYYRNTLCSVYYIISKKSGNIAYFKPYRNSMDKEVKYPIILVKEGGSMYKFIREDINKLRISERPSVH